MYRGWRRRQPGTASARRSRSQVSAMGEIGTPARQIPCDTKKSSGEMAQVQMKNPARWVLAIPVRAHLQPDVFPTNVVIYAC